VARECAGARSWRPPRRARLSLEAMEPRTSGSCRKQLLGSARPGVVFQACEASAKPSLRTHPKCEAKAGATPLYPSIYGAGLSSAGAGCHRCTSEIRANNVARSRNVATSWRDGASVERPAAVARADPCEELRGRRTWEIYSRPWQSGTVKGRRISSVSSVFFQEASQTPRNTTSVCEEARPHARTRTRTTGRTLRV
jgi:hypothetical protein